MYRLESKVVGNIFISTFLIFHDVRNFAFLKFLNFIDIVHFHGCVHGN